MKYIFCVLIISICLSLSQQRVMQNSFHELRADITKEEEDKSCTHYADMSNVRQDAASKHPKVGYAYYCETDVPPVASICPPINVIKPNFDYAAHNCPEPPKCKDYHGNTYYCSLTCKDPLNQQIYNCSDP